MICRKKAKNKKKNKKTKRKRKRKKIETIDKQTDRITLAKKRETKQYDEPRLCYKAHRTCEPLSQDFPAS